MQYKPLTPRSRADKPIFENIGTTSWDVLTSTARLASDEAAIFEPLYYEYTGKPLTEEEFNARYADSGLKYDSAYTKELVDYLINKKKRREHDEYIISRSRSKSNWLEAAKWTTSFVAGNLTPLNIAASFIPIGGQARWGAVALKYGAFKTSLAKGFVGGSIGQTAIEPFTKHIRNLEQRDYTFADSATNIAISGSFGSGLQAIGYGATYGFKKLKDKYYSTHKTLHDSINTNNPVVNKQFKELLSSLEDKTHPTGVKDEASTFNISEALNLKNTIWQEGKSKFPQVFDQEQKVAHFEESLHQEFASGGDKAKIPIILLRQLEAEQNKLFQLEQQYHDNPEFTEIRQRLEEIDSGILNRLEYDQQELRAYDLCERDIYIATRQLEEGKYIDLEDPYNSEYVFAHREEQFNLEHSTKPKESITHKDSLSSLAEPFNQTNHNKQKLQDAITFIDRYTLSPSEGLKDYLKQVDLRQMTIAQEYTGGLLNDLLKADLLEQFKSNSFESAIAKELYNITASSPKPTNSPQAKEIAGLIHKYQTCAITRANRSGANIKILAGYITRQSHNPYAMREAGFNKWSSFIVPLLDREKTDAGLDLYQVFNNLATGEHLYANSEYLPQDSINSNYNIAHSFEAARKLHFKSADAWLKYNERFGTNPLAESISMNLERLGKAIGILESIGSDPKATLQQLRKHYITNWQERAASNKNTHARAEFEFLTKSTKPDNILDLIIGNTTPQNPTIAKINSSWNSLRVMSDLGSVVLSSIPDAATFAAEQMNNGIPVLTAHANILKALTHSFTSKEKKEFAGAFGVATDNLLGSMHRELNGEYPLPNFLSKSVNIYMRLNLMNWWDNSFRSTLWLILSNNLATHLKKSYTSTPQQLRRILQNYDIGEHNWGLYRFLVKKAQDGNDYVLPTEQIPHEVLIKYLPEDLTAQNEANLGEINLEQKAYLTKLQDDISNNLRRYLRDRVDTGNPQTHAAQKYQTTRGTNAGTIEGALMRMFMQYKQYPINYLARPLKDYTIGQLPLDKRSGHLSDIPKGMLESKIFPTLLITATSLGYLSIAAKRIAKGEELPDPSTLETWLFALVKGGGLGLYGEFLLTNHKKRFNHSLLDELAGPRIIDIKDLIQSIYTNIHNRDLKQAIVDMKTLTCNNLALGHSLFYLPIATNKVFGLEPEFWNCRFKK